MRVLVLSSDAAIRQQACAVLRNAGIEALDTSLVGAARQAQGNRIHTVLAGAEFLTAETDAIAMAKPVPVVLMDSAPSVTEAVRSMRQGAADYLGWPCQAQRLVDAIRLAAAGVNVDTHEEFSPIIGDSTPMLELKQRVRQAARTDRPVLIQGEAGTGKELIARALHAISERRDGPFVALNATAAATTALEPALFGHDRAPSSGLIDIAQGGALFIKGIDLLPTAAQARLLHSLPEREGSDTSLRPSPESRVPECAKASPNQAKPPRIIATVQQDLRPLVLSGHFLGKLLDRLNQVRLIVPPLRERGDDIVQVARATMERTASRLDKSSVDLTAAAVTALRRHTWPGNVRELVSTVSRATSLSESTIDTDLLPFDDSEAAADLQRRATSGSLEDFFVRFVLTNQDQYTETELASQLGISRKSLWERRQRLNIPRRRTKKRGLRQPSDLT